MWGFWVAAQSRTGNEHKPTQIAAELESKNASESLRNEQTDWVEEVR